MASAPFISVDATPYSVETKTIRDNNIGCKDIINAFVDPTIGVIRRSGFKELYKTEEIVDVLPNVKDKDGEYLDLVFFKDSSIKAYYSDKIIPVTESTSYFNSVQQLSSTTVNGRIFVSNSAVKVQAEDNHDFTVPNVAILEILSGGNSLTYEIKVKEVSQQIKDLRTSYPPTAVPIKMGLFRITNQYVANAAVANLTPDGTIKVTTMLSSDMTDQSKIDQCQPEGIAKQLVTAIQQATPVTNINCIRDGRFILLYPTNEQGAKNMNSLELVCQNGTGRLTYNKTTTVERLPTKAIDNMLVMIGNSEDEVYYMQFFADVEPQAGSYNISTGEWKQSYKPKTANGILTASTMPHELVIDKTLLTAELKPFEWGFRVAGDESTNKEPDFVDSYIYNLRIIQNRLVISATDAIALSRTDDYLQFYRSTVTQLLDDERISYYINGLNATVEYDRNIIVSTDKQQYAINTKNALTPKTTAPALVGEIPLKGAQLYSNGDVVIGINNAGNDIKHTEISASSQAETLISLDLSNKVNGWLAGDVVDVTISRDVTTQFIATENDIYLCKYVNQSDRLYLYSRFTISQKYNNQKIKKIWDKDGYLYVLISYDDNGAKSSVLTLNLITNDYINSDLKYLDFYEDITAPYEPQNGEIVSFYYDIPEIENGNLLSGNAIKGYEYTTELILNKPVIATQNGVVEYVGVVRDVTLNVDFTTDFILNNKHISAKNNNVMNLDYITRQNTERKVYTGINADTGFNITTTNQTFILKKLLCYINIKKRF